MATLHFYYILLFNICFLKIRKANDYDPLKRENGGLLRNLKNLRNLLKWQLFILHLIPVSLD